MENTQKIQKFWDNQAKRFDQADKQFEAVYKLVFARLDKYLNPNDTILDYGCATGIKTIEFAKKVQHVHGLDISSEMIKEAIKKKDGSKINNISFTQGTIFSADFEKSSFDKVIAFGIIHLLEEKEKAVQRIKELLKPGGLFISTTACMRDKMDFKTRLKVSTVICMKKLGMFPLHLNLFKSKDVEKLFIDQNFEIVESEKLDKGIPAVFIIAKKKL